jgi:hypothetical protein
MCQTPYHSLLPQEKIIFKERKDLLAYIGKRFREEVIKYDDFLRIPTPPPGMSDIYKYYLFDFDCRWSNTNTEWYYVFKPYNFSYSFIDD